MAGLGLLAVSGLAAALTRASSYASELEARTLAEKDSCWLEVRPGRARLDYELSRLGLSVEGTPLETDAGLAAQVAGHQQLVVTYYRNSLEDLSFKLAMLLLALHKETPRGSLRPSRVDEHDDMLLVFYDQPSPWAGTFQEFYAKKGLDLKSAAVFLCRLGEVLSFYEANGWTYLGRAGDLQVDDLGLPALVPAAIARSGPTSPMRDKNQQGGSIYLSLWAEAGTRLCQPPGADTNIPPTPFYSSIYKAARERTSSMSFGARFELWRAEWEP